MNIINLTGTNLTNPEGTGREYTITPTVYGVPIFLLDNATLVSGIDFTYDANTQHVTFNSYILNTQYITIYYDAGIPVIIGSRYTNASEVQEYLRLTAAFDASTYPSLDTVNSWIDEESNAIDLMTNQVFSSILSSSEYIDYDGQDVLRLPQFPIISIIEVKYNLNGLGDTPSWVTFTEGFDSDYLSYLYLGEIEFIPGINRTSNTTPKSGKKKFCITYTYGYNSVPLEIKRLVTLRVAREVIVSLLNSQANIQGGEIQVGTIRVADPSMYGINSISLLDKESDRYQKIVGLNLRTYRGSRVY